MMKKMMENMSKGEMKGMMDKMMKECCADMIAEDKQKMAEEIKSGSSKGGEMPMMPQIMMEMMPQCLEMMLPKLSKEDRNHFVFVMASILLANVDEKVKTLDGSDVSTNPS